MTKKINKILIANRGEIACRVMKTARKLGIKTVAVCSDADKKALHTRMADEAVHIGASPAAESYLVIDKIIDACKQTGADAVHPGYGFLSENPAFVRACDKAGIIFIGPKAESMEAMGLKDAAKKLMVEAGVPVTPGYHGKDQTPSVLETEAKHIGYPVLIKAVAGGGGKGMRKVEAEDDFLSALASCQREAKSSFGDDRVLIEKYITSPRHIEVQIFGDTHGNVVHMFERDCSLQRRHQKVIEEAPAPGMTEDVRKAMTDAAVQAAKAVDYIGAGTVEFIVDGSGKLRTDGFWFMEMNTRLQVEHPVSEMITGLDFVELQIRVAEGGKLPKQDDIIMDGHAIEARLYAEDPANDFLPSIGDLEAFTPADEMDKWKHERAVFIEAMNNNEPLFVDPNTKWGWRTDTGVTSGDEISVFYDPMIAKFISYSHERLGAIKSLTSLIRISEIKGVVSNADFLQRCLFHPDFVHLRDGEVFQASTNLIADNFSMLTQVGLEEESKFIAVAAASLTFALLKSAKQTLSFSHVDCWRLNQERDLFWFFEKGSEPLEVKVTNYSIYSCTISIGSDVYDIVNEKKDTFLQQMGHRGKLATPGLPKDVTNFRYWETLNFDDVVLIADGYYNLVIPRYVAGFEDDSTASGNALTAPMPGKVIAVNAASGATVKSGDPLIIMEAMKMEMTLEAPRDGVVAAVNVETNTLVSDGDILLEMAEEE